MGSEIGSDTEDVVETVDGRTLRRRRNRDAVINALISLISEGDLDPTIDKVADRAEVSARSIFRYFTDLNDLAATAIETEIRNVMPLATIPDVGVGPLEDRIDSLVASRLRVVQRTYLLTRVARLKAHAIPDIDRGLANGARVMLDQLRRHFAPELARMEPDEADRITTMLMSTMGNDVYDILHRYYERTDEEIADSWRELLTRCLR